MTKNNADAIRWMRPALRASAQARGQTGSNPNVGVAHWRDNGLRQVCATAQGGRPHAEAQLVDVQAGDVIAVTLEPCAHEGVTGSCAQFLIQRKPSLVVVGLIDPDSRTAGKGIAALEHAGITVVTGVEEKDAGYHMAGFLTRIRAQRPYVRLKVAMSKDGRTALPNGHSQWITGEEARVHSHILRYEADAIMVGAKTADRDKPSLTCRLGGHVLQPKIFVLQGRHAHGYMPDDAMSIGTGSDADIMVPSDEEGFPNLKSSLNMLAKRGINNLLVESGGALAASLLRHQLVDELFIYQSPLILGSECQPGIGPLGLRQLQMLDGMSLVEQREVGRDMLCRYIFDHNAHATSLLRG